jgi:UDP-N-acetylglucosamine 1-carboxyvinyltransferase
VKFIINGGKSLSGELKVSGNKNSILPCMAAALLTSEEVILENVPDISDVSVFTDIMEGFGVQIVRSEHTLKIVATDIKNSEVSEELMKKIRASILFVGPLLSRKGEVIFSHPGGDVIGGRSIQVHLNAFKELGVKIEQNDNKFKATVSEQKENSNIFLEEASLTAAENLVLSSVLGVGSVFIRNCPPEPGLVDLCLMLNLMGAKINGVGTNTLEITRVSKLSGTNFKVSDDFVEIGTYAIAAAITGGEIRIKYSDTKTDIEPLKIVLKKFGLNFKQADGALEVSASSLTSVGKVVTNIWPGFPTDFMSPVIVLATQATGVTLCHDWMYESRMFFVDKLIAMGANITIADPHRVLVYGPSKLQGRELETPDIRAGMALVLAALIAKGESVINRAELIERGYEDVVGKLSSLGADIRKVE